MPEFFAYAPLDLILKMRDKGLIEKTGEGWVTTGPADILIQEAVRSAINERS